MVQPGGPLGPPFADLPAHRADHVRVDRLDHRHDVVHADVTHRGHHGFAPGQRVRPDVRPPAEEVGQPFVPVRGPPGGFGQRTQHLPPPVPGRPDLGVDRVDHQVEQLLLGAM